MSQHRPRRSAVALVGLVGLVVPTMLSACSGDEPAGADTAETGSAASPAPVELDVDDAVDPITLGVVVSLTAPPGEGQDDLPGAAGVRVAQYRLGADLVELKIADDGGTAEGAQEAVATLLDADVSGLVVASQGTHLDAALRDASAAGVAVLAPYVRTPEPLPDGVWATGPSQASVAARLNESLQRQDLTRPVVVAANRIATSGIGTGERIALRGRQVEPAVDAVREGVADDSIDSVVVAGDATTQAAIVSRLQGTVPDVPVLLTPDALSPDFATGLVEDGGTPAGRFSTVGTDAADPTTLSTGPRADAVASYFAALRLAAADPDTLDLFGSGPFADVAAGADTASHDAVVALVRAAEAAGSGAPEDVRETLGGLSLDAGDGIAGAPMDFSTAQVVDGSQVVALKATTQDPGVRPASTGTRLFWFAVPGA